MHSQRSVLSVISALLIFLGAAGGLTATAAPASGTVGLSSATAGAVQNIGVRTITVNRRGGSSGAASVRCTTVNNTAVAGRDFTAIDKVITWSNGDGADKGCNVTISNATPFTGQKTFYIRLSDARGAPLGAAQTLVKIYGDKDGGLVSLSAATYTVSQSTGAVTITVNRTNGSSGSAWVAYATANGTAVAGTNYASTRGGLGWGNKDAAAKTIVIPINRTAFTGTKTLAIALACAENASLGAIKSAIVTIKGTAATQAPATGSATVSWKAPTKNTDGTPAADLTGYNIYYGKSPTALTSVITVNNPASATYTINKLTPGTWYFGIKAYDSQAEESGFSSIVSAEI
jgi:hypothetical protein